MRKIANFSLNISLSSVLLRVFPTRIFSCIFLLSAFSNLAYFLILCALWGIRNIFCNREKWIVENFPKALLLHNCKCFIHFNGLSLLFLLTSVFSSLSCARFLFCTLRFLVPSHHTQTHTAVDIGMLNFYALAYLFTVITHFLFSHEF